MANKKKKKESTLADEAVQRLFKQIRENDVLTDDEFESLTEGYECLKQLVVPNMYSEVAMTLITVIYSKLNANNEGHITTDEVINGTLDDSVVGKAIWHEMVSNEEDLWMFELLNDTYENKFDDSVVPKVKKKKAPRK